MGEGEKLGFRKGNGGFGEETGLFRKFPAVTYYSPCKSEEDGIRLGV